jgi:propionyl-CoA carboxylase alpha chain
VLKKQMAKEAEIAALVALKQYFEDQKIVRLSI